MPVGISTFCILKKISFWQAGRQNSVELVISGYLLMLMLMLMYISFAVVFCSNLLLRSWNVSITLLPSLWDWRDTTAFYWFPNNGIIGWP